MTPTLTQRIEAVADEIAHAALHTDTEGDGFVLTDIERRVRQIAAEVQQWQPIESAPRDGTPILVCYADQYDTNGFLPAAVRFRSYHPNAKGKEEFRTSNGTKVEVITHWMPLPSPPTQDPQA